MKQKRISYALARKICDEICVFHNIKCEYLKKCTDFRGEVSLETNTISISLELNTNPYHLIKTVMHEAIHILCSRAGVYAGYHIWPRTCGVLEQKNYWKRYLKVALRAERYVDKLADKWFHTLFPGKSAFKAYRSKSHMKWFETNVRKVVRRNIAVIETYLP